MVYCIQCMYQKFTKNDKQLNTVILNWKISRNRLRVWYSSGVCCACYYKWQESQDRGSGIGCFYWSLYRSFLAVGMLSNCSFSSYYSKWIMFFVVLQCFLLHKGIMSMRQIIYCMIEKESWIEIKSFFFKEMGLINFQHA